MTHVRQAIPNYAQAIRDFRASRALSQSALARLLDISTITVHFWESGRSYPSPYLREALRRVGLSDLPERETVDRRVKYPVTPVAQRKETTTTKPSRKPRAIGGSNPCPHCGGRSFLNNICEDCGK